MPQYATIIGRILLFVFFSGIEQLRCGQVTGPNLSRCSFILWTGPISGHNFRVSSHWGNKRELIDRWLPVLQFQAYPCYPRWNDTPYPLIVRSRRDDINHWDSQWLMSNWEPLKSIFLCRSATWWFLDISWYIIDPFSIYLNTCTVLVDTCIYIIYVYYYICIVYMQKKHTKHKHILKHIYDTICSQIYRTQYIIV